MPQKGLGDFGALDALAPVALEGCAQLSHPGYLAHMDPASADVACGAALWQVATNQNPLHPDAAPSARALEQTVVKWFAPYFGMAGGHFVPGSTVANLTALWAAREVAGVKRVIASDRAHNSVAKAAHLLGLAYIPVRSDPSTHRCSMNNLQAEDLGSGRSGGAGTRPVDLSDAALVLTCGTVSTGRIDELSWPADAAWVHIDAAWAGPMLLSPQLAPLLSGVERADSVGFSAHKWLYQPKGSAMVLFKDPAKAHAPMSFGAGYLAVPTVGVLGSQPASALPLAATLLAWGAEGVARQLDEDVAKLDKLCDLIAIDGRFELWGGGPSCGVLAWRPLPHLASAGEVRNKLQGAWVSLTVIDRETWFRSVAANPKADPEVVFKAVVAAMEEIQKEELLATD